MSEEKSAIDLIYEMHEMLIKMQDKISVLEKSNTLLIDLLAKQAATHDGSIKGREVKIETPPSVAPIVIEPQPIIPPAPIITTPPTIVQAGPENKSQSTKISGVLKDSEGKVLHGLSIAIVDAKTNTVVKNTKTNRAGEFISFLPLGKYIAVATFENNQQKFKAFDVPPGSRDIEVSIV